MTSCPDDDSSVLPLDITHILLTTVIRPVENPFRTMPFPIADHQRHIYSVTVEKGMGTLSSGSPVARSSPEFTRQVSTSDEDCPDFLKELANNLKSKTEEVNDISIQNFVLQFGLIENQKDNTNNNDENNAENNAENNNNNNSENTESDPYLLGCDGSTFTPSAQLEPYVSFMTIFTLFYAVEMSVNPIPSQCITRGRFCSAGTQSIERSKIISYHISCIAQAAKNSETKSNNNTKGINNNNNDDSKSVASSYKSGSKESITKYLKSRINTLCPIIMMSSVNVCASCFKFYSIDATQPKKATAINNKECSAATLSDNNRSLIVRKEQRPTTTMAKRGNSKQKNGEPKNNLPIVRAPPPPYMIGNLTASGLRVASNNSTKALELARRTYNHNNLFLHVPPPKPEFKYKLKHSTL